MLLCNYEPNLQFEIQFENPIKRSMVYKFLAIFHTEYCIIFYDLSISYFNKIVYFLSIGDYMYIFQVFLAFYIPG